MTPEQQQALFFFVFGTSGVVSGVVGLAFYVLRSRSEINHKKKEQDLEAQQTEIRRAATVEAAASAAQVTAQRVMEQGLKRIADLEQKAIDAATKQSENIQRITDLETAIRQKTDEVLLLKEQIEAQDARIAGQSEKIEQQNQKIAELTDQITQLTTLNEDLRESSKAMAQENDGLRAALAGKEAALGAAIKERDDAVELRKQMETERDTAIARQAELQAEIDALRKPILAVPPRELPIQNEKGKGTS